MMKPSFRAAMITMAIAIVDPSIQAQNVNDLVKWSSAQVVHYDVVAEYSGTATILPTGANGKVYQTAVRDRFEMGFDWSPLEMTLVGTPVVKNFPSTLPTGTPAVSSMGQPCPQPRLTGPYEHFEVVSAKAGLPGANSLDLNAKRTYPAGAVPYAMEGPCDLWAASPAKTETVAVASMLVPPGMYLAMPVAAGSGVTVGKDGKTITMVDKSGWTYTHTLRIVR